MWHYATVAGEVGAPAYPEDGLVGEEVDRFFDSYALWATGILAEDILAEAQEVLEARLQTPAEVITALDDALGDYLPERDAAGRVVNIPLRLETIARTNLATANQAGRMAAFTDPDLDDGFLVGFEYSAVLDDRVREAHLAWDGIVRPATFWNDLGVPPSGFNCRCTLVPVTVYDGMSVTDEADLPDAEIPDDGFVGRQQR